MGRLGLGGNLRRASQESREIVAKADHAVLGLALRPLGTAAWLRRGPGESGHVIGGNAPPRLGGGCPLGTASLVAFLLPPRRTAFGRFLARRRGAPPATPIALFEVELGGGDALDLHDRDIPPNQRLDRGDVLALFRSGQRKGAALAAGAAGP